MLARGRGAAAREAAAGAAVVSGAAGRRRRPQGEADFYLAEHTRHTYNACARSAASADEALAAAARQLLDEPLQELHTQAAGYQIDYSLTTTGFTGLAEDGSLDLPRNTTGSYTLSFDMRKLDG